jgi:hypothetical protein
MLLLLLLLLPYLRHVLDVCFVEVSVTVIVKIVIVKSCLDPSSVGIGFVHRSFCLFVPLPFNLYAGVPVYLLGSYIVIDYI